MGFIAFSSDWGLKSYYVGVCKAIMKRISPSSPIIDLTHEIEPFNAKEAMHILYRAFNHFPPQTVFLVVVDYGVGTERKAIALETESHYFFVGPDNGIFTLIIEEEKIKSIVELNNPDFFYLSQPTATFHGRDIFAPASAYLSQETPIEKLGEFLLLSDLSLLPYQKSFFSKGKLIGEIAFFDRFGNIETNIPSHLFEQFNLKKGKEVMVELGSKKIVSRYSSTYGEVPAGEFTIHVDSSGYVEISENHGNAKACLGVEQSELISLEPVQ